MIVAGHLEPRGGVMARPDPFSFLRGVLTLVRGALTVLPTDRPIERAPRRASESATFG